MNGPLCHFRLVDGATLTAIRGSRLVPEPFLLRLKEELAGLVAQVIIGKVTEPTAWVHPIVLVPKKDNGIKLCVDLGHKCFVRPRFGSQTPFQAVLTIPPGMKLFTVVDALKGYHQVPLDAETVAMTTFSTPVGRYQYLWLPFGVVQAGEDYCRRVADIFDDIPNTRRFIIQYIQYNIQFVYTDLQKDMGLTCRGGSLAVRPGCQTRCVVEHQEAEVRAADGEVRRIRGVGKPLPKAFSSTGEPGVLILLQFCLKNYRPIGRARTMPWGRCCSSASGTFW